jgi:hypothetical protein
MNICFYSGLIMAFPAALDIGTRKSTKLSLKLVLLFLLRIRASSPVVFKIPAIQTVMFPISPSLLVSTLATVSTSWRISRSRNYFAAFSEGVAKKILSG